MKRRTCKFCNCAQNVCLAVQYLSLTMRFCVWQRLCGITYCWQLSWVCLASAVRNRFRYVRISFTVFSSFFSITESRKVTSCHSKHAATNKLINALSSSNAQSVRNIDTSLLICNTTRERMAKTTKVLTTSHTARSGGCNHLWKETDSEALWAVNSKHCPSES